MRPLPALLLLVLVALAWGVRSRWIEEHAGASGPRTTQAPPVEVAPVERGDVVLRRTFNGSLEPSAVMVVASKVAGRVLQLEVDLGDPVTRGQVVALLDDAELVQDEQQAQAQLAVARASQAEAESTHQVAERALQRARALRADGVTSEQALDAAVASELEARVGVEVAEAQVLRAGAALEAARIRLGDARVVADWDGGDTQRVVARRYLDEGSSVSSNSPLLEVVSLDPVVAVLQVPERDYARLAPGLTANLTTDAHPGQVFEGVVERIAPVFRQDTRLARVELRVANPDGRLRPGMFVRATLDLERASDVVLVPFDALTERDGATGVFRVDTAELAHWTPVRAGIREGDRQEVGGLEVPARVVVLGQDLCTDGEAVTVVAPVPTPGAERRP